MTCLVFHTKEDTLPIQPNQNIHVWLYGATPPYPHAGIIGHQVLDYASRLTVRPSLAAFDFVSIALAVTAADTFVLRSEAPNCWNRTFELVLPLAQPDRWKAVQPELEKTLRFLSNDQWHFEFIENGVPPPSEAQVKSRQRVTDLSKVDCVSLFSGGLDSGIGAIDLLAQGRRPLLVSHAPHGDADRQVAVQARLPGNPARVAVNTYPRMEGSSDDSMRTRSFQFIALAALAADTISQFRGMPCVDLFVCENGLIALNPPLTPRRLGSHSTRTAHPYFLGGMQAVLQKMNLAANITNPYRHLTKGEIVTNHAADLKLKNFAAETVSCGKWKRKNQQCGRCVPCLIRRASLHHAGVEDLTSYQEPDLKLVMKDNQLRDDLIAVQAAIIRPHNLKNWVLQAGPLPEIPAERVGHFEVAQRGMDELRSFLTAEGMQL